MNKAMPAGRRGFTLIELIVTITIVGILSAIGFTTYPNVRKKAKDTQRKSDLSQYRNGLENFASSHNGLYPLAGNRPWKAQILLSSSESECIPNSSRPLYPYLSTCATDPVNSGLYGYYYRTDGTTSDINAGTTSKYILWAMLETGGYWAVCSDGRSGKVTTVDGTVNCPLP